MGTSLLCQPQALACCTISQAIACARHKTVFTVYPTAVVKLAVGPWKKETRVAEGILMSVIQERVGQVVTSERTNQIDIV